MCSIVSGAFCHFFATYRLAVSELYHTKLGDTAGVEAKC